MYPKSDAGGNRFFGARNRNHLTIANHSSMLSMNSQPQPLSVNRLHKKYGNFEVIRDLNLEVEHQAIHGLVGLNGSGKTTTLECILGLQHVTSGEISVLGYKPSELYRAQGNIVGIFDTPSLHPNLTVRQCLQHASLLCKDKPKNFLAMEKLLGIEKYSNFKIRHLSLGNKRRASIAQALLGRPALIILDEPFNGLDAGGVEDMLALIKTLNQDDGTAFLLSSHQLPYLEQVCTHIAILHQGRIAVSDKIDELFNADKATVLLKCDQQDKVLNLVNRSTYTQFKRIDHNGFLHIELRELTTADFNRQLVERSIAISELRIERSSLSSLFRNITSEPD